MQISLVAIGKLKDPSLNQLYNEYEKRLDWKINVKEFSNQASKDQEEQILLKAIPSSSYLIALDEGGENITSLDFAKLLENIQLHHNGNVCFVIGGADGLGNNLKKSSQKSLAFGRMTWPHLLARVLLMEQLYRAQQILKSHPYHRA